MKRAQPSKKQVGLAFGAAFAFLLVAIIDAAVAASGGPRWYGLSAVGFASASLLWSLVAARWKRSV